MVITTLCNSAVRVAPLESPADGLEFIARSLHSQEISNLPSNNTSSVARRRVGRFGQRYGAASALAPNRA